MSQFIFINRNQSLTRHKFYATTYADLASLVPEVGDIAYVYTTTNGLFQTKRIKGAYDWNGTTWEYSSQEIQNQVATNIAQIESNDTDILILQNGKLDKGTYTGDAQSIFDAIPDVSTLLPSGNYLGTAEDLFNLINRLTWASWIEDKPSDLANENSALMNQTTQFEPYFGIRNPQVNVDLTGTWSQVLPYTGSYEIELDFRFSINTTTTNFLSHILLDGNEFNMLLHIEAKDSGGAGLPVPTVQNNQLTGNNVNTGTDQFLKGNGKRIIQRNAGDQLDLRFEFASQVNNQEATIYNAIIIVRYIENQNTPFIPPSIGTATISYNSFFGGFNATIEITNNSGAAINSWAVIVSGTNWDATNNFGQCVITDLGNDNWQFENVGFNGAIPNGGTLQFSFQGTTGNAGGIQSPTNGQLSVSGS